MENNEKDHLALISEMISMARREYEDNAYIYLLWGWAVCLASLTEYVLIKMGKDYHGWVWMSMPVVALIQIIMMLVNRKNKPHVKTRMDRTIGNIWIAVMVSFGIVLFSSDLMQYNTYPVFILLYGIGTFISGGIMDLKVMKAGAICCWVIGAIAFRVSFEYQLLLLSLSLILSYIIPGHLLKARSKSHV